MVNRPRIHCHSAFQHYEMYHWDCGNSDTYNTTYNFNGGSIFGGGFGGGFWNGVGMGLGAGLMSIFGFGGGGGGWGCFGGGMPMYSGGMGLFGGFPQISSWWGGSSAVRDGAGGQSTTTTNNNTVIREHTTTTPSHDNKDEKKLNKLKDKVNKFIEEYKKDKASGKLNEQKALKKATELYDKFPATLKDDVITDKDEKTIRESREKLALLFPELAVKYEKDYHKKPGTADQDTPAPVPKDKQVTGNQDGQVITNPDDDHVVPDDENAERPEIDLTKIATEEELNKLKETRPDLTAKIDAEIQRRKDAAAAEAAEAARREQEAAEAAAKAQEEADKAKEIREKVDFGNFILTDKEVIILDNAGTMTDIDNVRCFKPKGALSIEALSILKAKGFFVAFANNPSAGIDQWIIGKVGNYNATTDGKDIQSYTIDCSEHGKMGLSFKVTKNKDDFTIECISDSHSYESNLYRAKGGRKYKLTGGILVYDKDCGQKGPVVATESMVTSYGRDNYEEIKKEDEE